MNQIFLGIGTNLGDRWANIEQCSSMIHDRVGSILSRSATYESTAWGFEGPDFYNEVWEMSSKESPSTLLAICKRIESEVGRVKEEGTERYHSRLLDIDILSYGDLVIEEPGLRIPHRLVAKREFVLRPWAEIAPHMLVAGLDRTVLELLTELGEHNCKRIAHV